MSTRAAAVEAARAGWQVFPCRPGGKRPAVDSWEQRACRDPVVVSRYWPSDRHNVGIACGPSGLVVIDLDTAAHGAELAEVWRARGVDDGQGVLAELAARAGQGWPQTLMVVTPSGGRHLYFRALAGREIRNSAGKIGPMIDVRAAGGYVLGAGSVVGGRLYEVGAARPVLALPSWLADLAAPLPRVMTGPAAAVPVAGGPVYGRLRGLIEAVLSSAPGTRNGRLFWAACRAAEMVIAGQVDESTAEELLVRAALEAGLRGGEMEARRTVRSGLRQQVKAPTN